MYNKKINKWYGLITMLHHIKEHWGYMIGCAVLEILSQGIPFIVLLYLAKLIGYISMEKNIEYINYKIIILCILIFLNPVIRYINMWCAHDLAYRILRDIRMKVYHHIEKVIPSFNSEKTSGELVQIISEDIEVLEWFYAHTMTIVMSTLFVAIGSIICLFKIQTTIGNCVLIGASGAFILPIIYQQYTRKIGSDILKPLGKVSGLLTEAIQGMKDIWSYEWADVFMNKFKVLHWEYTHAYRKDVFRRSGERLIFLILNLITYMVILIVIAQKYNKGMLQSEYVLVTMVIVYELFECIKKLSGMVQQFGTILGASEHVSELLALPCMVNNIGKLQPPSQIESICFENVEYKYPLGETSVLKNINFTLKAGEITALVGASGSGKSTIMLLLMRYIDPDKGRIIVNGIDIKQFSLESWRDCIGFVEQKTYIFNESVEDNLRRSCHQVTEEHFECVKQEAKIDVFVTNMEEGYNTRLGEGGARLSGGECQRLSIARALLKEAKILLLDEATASLDSVTEHAIQKILLKEKKHQVTLMAVHNNATIKYADNIILMEEGCVLQQDKADVVFNHPIFKSQIQGIDKL